jgi:hypothetical protein
MGQESVGHCIGVYHVEHYDAAGRLLWSEDTHNRLYNQGQFAILDIALRGGTAPASWYIGLMSNNLQSQPAVSSTLATLAGAGPYELTAGDTGYSARQPINRDATAAGWPTLGVVGAGEQATAATVTWTNTGGVPWVDTVRWMFLSTVGTVGDTTGKFISLAQLNVDRLMNPGDRLQVTYSLLLT